MNSTGSPVDGQTPQWVNPSYVGFDSLLIGNWRCSVSQRGSERTGQRGDRTGWRAKNSDSFNPLGPWIVTGQDYRKMTTVVRLNGEVAYLPSVTFSGVDNHFFGNSGQIASVNPEAGKGRGVQLEAAVSYFLTPELSLGVGVRYWAMWTSADGSVTRTVNNGVPITPTPPQFFKGAAEQAAAFVQASYKLGN